MSKEIQESSEVKLLSHISEQSELGERLKKFLEDNTDKIIERGSFDKDWLEANVDNLINQYTNANDKNENLLKGDEGIERFIAFVNSSEIYKNYLEEKKAIIADKKQIKKTKSEIGQSEQSEKNPNKLTDEEKEFLNNKKNNIENFKISLDYMKTNYGIKLGGKKGSRIIKGLEKLNQKYIKVKKNILRTEGLFKSFKNGNYDFFDIEKLNELNEFNDFSVLKGDEAFKKIKEKTDGYNDASTPKEIKELNKKARKRLLVDLKQILEGVNNGILFNLKKFFGEYNTLLSEYDEIWDLQASSGKYKGNFTLFLEDVKTLELISSIERKTGESLL